jgi:hypothetical protein
MTDDSSAHPSAAPLEAARLGELLRAAVPRIGDAGPPRDLWPRVVDRFDQGSRWSLLDVGLAAAVAVWLSIFPEWLLVLIYHL